MALKSSPTRSCINLIFFHSISSRSASSARRSDWLDSAAIAFSSASGIGPSIGLSSLDERPLALALSCQGCGASDKIGPPSVFAPD